MRSVPGNWEEKKAKKLYKKMETIVNIVMNNKVSRIQNGPMLTAHDRKAALIPSAVAFELPTCFHCLPAQGEGAAGLQVVGGDWAVVVSCRAPGECGCAFGDLLHDHYPRRARGAYRQRGMDNVKDKP